MVLNSYSTNMLYLLKLIGFFSALLLCFVSKEEVGPYFKSLHQLLVINSQGTMFWIKINDFSMLLSADTLQPTLSFSLPQFVTIFAWDHKGEKKPLSFYKIR